MANEAKIHPYSKKPVSYKLVSREVPGLLPKEGSLVWKRAGFARHAVHVTKCESAPIQPSPITHVSDSHRILSDRDDELWPAGRHVPQTSGEPSRGIPEWIGDGSTSTSNTDVVLWHTFGVTHIPSPEDFPVMPVEPITLLLRPRNFFLNNPVMDVLPSYSSTPSQVAGKSGGVVNAADKQSTLAFRNSAGRDCCSKL